ncbi:MAG: hypothetical protein R2876_06800 [Eubacteriales bacterium]
MVNSDNNQPLRSFQRHLKSGWSNEEIELLSSESSLAEKNDLPLNYVFETVAKKTGRRPNSIRNFYYLKMRENSIGLHPRLSTFVPFNNAEISELIREVLISQAKGESVRSCTLRIANGDKQKMLRLQNKYRSTIRSNRDLVNSIMLKLTEENILFFNPYVDKTLRGRKPLKIKEKQLNLVKIIGDIIKNLDYLGEDTECFFKSFLSLTEAAVQNVSLSKQPTEPARQDDLLNRLNKENIYLEQKQKQLLEENTFEKQKYDELYKMYHQLLEANKNFLSLNGLNKISELSNYIDTLNEAIGKAKTG